MTVERSGTGGRSLFVDYLDRHRDDIVGRWTDRVLRLPSFLKRLARVPRPTHESGLHLLFGSIVDRLAGSTPEEARSTLSRVIVEGYLGDFAIGDVILYLTAVREILRERLATDATAMPLLRALEAEVDLQLAWAAEIRQASGDEERRSREQNEETRARELRAENDSLRQTNADIRRTVEQLRGVVERYRALSENASDGIFVVDPESFALLEANVRFEQLLGLSGEDLLRTNLLRLVVPEQVAAVLGSLDEVLDAGGQVRRTLTFRTPTDESIALEVSFGRIRIEGERFIVQAIAREGGAHPPSRPEVTPRTQPEESRTTSSESARSEREPSSSLGPALPSRDIENEAKSPPRSGTAEELLFEEGPGESAAESDTTSAGGLELLWGTLPAPAWLARPNGELLEINDEAAILLDARGERLEGSRLPDCFVADDRASVGALVSQGGFGLFRVPSRSGSERELAVLAVPFAGEPGGEQRILGVLADRSAEAIRQQHAQQDRHMASLQRISGGVAHDFNNFLSSILGYASLVKETLPEHDANHGRVLKLEKAALYAASLVQDLLFLGRRNTRYDLRTVDPNDLVRDAAKQLKRSVQEDIEVRTRLARQAPKVELDPNQWQRALMQLGRNAADSMPERGQVSLGTSIVRVEPDELPDGFVGPLPEAGSYLVFSVADTGPGIPLAARSHLFEAYFTTKESGTGSGLGLATVYKIVRDHGGYLRVDSSERSGSVFMLFVPLEDLPESEEAEPARATVPQSELSGSETILIAEDDEMVRAMVTEVLGRYGYRTVTAQNGQEALDLYRRKSSPIDLVFLDVDMPLMDGLTAYKELRGFDPKVKVILTTGFGKQGQVQEVVEEESVAFLPKPCRQEDLLKKIRDVLDERTPTA
ncbi:MAG: response regulator [Planctomycetota bacterium]